MKLLGILLLVGALWTFWVWLDSNLNNGDEN